VLAERALCSQTDPEPSSGKGWIHPLANRTATGLQFRGECRVRARTTMSVSASGPHRAASGRRLSPRTLTVQRCVASASTGPGVDDLNSEPALF